IYALVQAAGVDPIAWPVGRPASTMGHPVIFAGALALALPFALAFAVDGRSRGVRFAWSGICLVQGLALILTLARGPWLAALGGVVVFAALARPAHRSLGPRLARLALCGLLVLAGALAAS